MPRVAVSINPGYCVPSVGSRVGPNGRRVRDLSAIVDAKSKKAPLAALDRAVSHFLPRLFMLAVRVGCFLAGAIGYVFLRFY